MALRFSHYINKNHGTELPNNILIVDTESHIDVLNKTFQNQTFRLGYAIYLERRHHRESEWTRVDYELRSVDDFWNILDKYRTRKIRLYVFAHNMSYDYVILKLDSYISSRKLDVRMDVRDTVFMIKAGNILFLSSTNYYKHTLKELGTIFGLSKMETPDFKNVSDEKLMPYCKRDTDVLTKIILDHMDFIRDNDLGSFKPTIASQAFTAFRHRFMAHNILVHDHDEILKLEKDSYRGGRCECFRMGKFKDITCLDINSMYPYVMKNYEYPTVLKSSNIAIYLPVKILKKEIENGTFVLADCTMKLKEPIIAVKREKLYFPIGKIRQTITSPEIEYILKNPECGEILKVHEAVGYSKADIFKKYVEFFYDLRQRAKNKAIEIMCKGFLNSLYGKFGQNRTTNSMKITDETLIKHYFSIMDSEHTHEIFVGPKQKYQRRGTDLYFIENKDGNFSFDACPIIASAVTAFARMLLWKLINIAGKENVIYCDTDSLFVTKEGLRRLSNEISPTELGKLKIVESGTVEIRGAKDYTFNGKIKLKGIKPDAKKISKNKYIQQQFHTKNQRYRDGTPDGIVVVKSIKKKLSRNYDKGMVEPDGSISPLIFND